MRNDLDKNRLKELQDIQLKRGISAIAGADIHTMLKYMTNYCTNPLNPIDDRRFMVYVADAIEEFFTTGLDPLNPMDGVTTQDILDVLEELEEWKKKRHKCYNDEEDDDDTADFWKGTL